MKSVRQVSEALGLGRVDPRSHAPDDVGWTSGPTSHDIFRYTYLYGVLLPSDILTLGAEHTNRKKIFPKRGTIFRRARGDLSPAWVHSGHV